MKYFYITLLNIGKNTYCSCIYKNPQLKKKISGKQIKLIQSIHKLIQLLQSISISVDLGLNLKKWSYYLKIS